MSECLNDVWTHQSERINDGLDQILNKFVNLTNFMHSNEIVVLLI